MGEQIRCGDPDYDTYAEGSQPELLPDSAEIKKDGGFSEAFCRRVFAETRNTEGCETHPVSSTPLLTFL